MNDPRRYHCQFLVSKKRYQAGEFGMNPLQLPRQLKKALESGIWYLLLSIDSFRSK